MAYNSLLPRVVCELIWRVLSRGSPRPTRDADFPFCSLRHHPCSDLAWSYSRSQAQHKGLGSSPSFTERHWAGPQHGQESEDGGETDDFESEFGADEESSQAISSDDGEDAQSMEGLDHEGSRTLETTPTQHRYSSRQVQRLTQDAREERYRSRSRSPKRLALSSGMALRDSGEWVDGDGTIGGRGRARGREGVEGDDDGSAQEYRDYRGALSGMEQGATSRARVGSHHERYSLRSSSRDFSDDEGDDDRGDSSNRRPRVHRRSSSSSSAGLDHRNGRLDMGTPLPSFANERTALLERRHGISSARSEGGKAKVKEAQNGVHHPTTHSTKDDDGEDDRVSLPAGKSALLSRVWSVTFGCCLRRRRSFEGSRTDQPR